MVRKFMDRFKSLCESIFRIAVINNQYVPVRVTFADRFLSQLMPAYSTSVEFDISMTEAKQTLN